MKILQLTLKKKPFDVMISGEKKKEIRIIKQYWKSRLYDKKGNPRVYDFVKFTNGYGNHRPSFTAEFKRCTIVNSVNKIYSNGLKVKMDKAFCIELGNIIKTKNI